MHTLRLAVLLLATAAPHCAFASHAEPSVGLEQDAIADTGDTSSSPRALQARMESLHGLKAESFEWQVEAQQIARALHALPSSAERQRLVDLFKREVGAFVRRDASLAAQGRLQQSTDAWAQRADAALSAPSIGMRVTAVQDGEHFVATVSNAAMRRSLAESLASKSGLMESARGAGFDRLDFVNNTTAEKWSYPLNGGRALRAQIMRETEARWALISSE
jgi:hypothetical protein